ncbi:MAG: transporter [Flavobacteriales bacterium]|nr:transporter [Flavobacteriales bacterium]
MRKISIILVCLGPSLLFGQACCSGGVPIASNLGSSISAKQQLQALFTYDYNRLDDLVQQSNLLDDQSRDREIHSALLELNYGFSQRISLTALLSGVYQIRNNNIINVDNTTVVSGMGDLVLLPKYNWVPPGKSYLISSGVGIKIPTGRSDIQDEQGIDLPIDLQPGTGAWDLIFWSNALIQNIKSKNLSVATNFTYRLAGDNDSYLGSLRHSFGNEFILNLGVAQRTFFLKNIWDFGFGVRYRNVQADNVNDEIVPSTGGHWLDINPSIALNFNPKSAIRIGMLQPVYRRLEETQLTTSFKLYASLNFTISLKKANEHEGK